MAIKLERNFDDNSIAALFDGQGIFEPGMGKAVHTRYAAAREVFKETSDAAGIDLARVCFGDLTHFQDDPRIVQPAIVTVDLAEYVAWREQEGLEPDVVTGLSLGMYAAYGAAGVFNSYNDAVSIVAHRARIAYQVEKSRDRVGKMAAIIGSKLGDLEPILHKVGAEVAVIRDRARYHFIVSGDDEEVDRAKQEAENIGARRTEDLKISGAWHSRRQKETAIPFREVLSNFTFNKPHLAVISNTAEYLDTPEMIVNDSVDQLTERSDWDAVLESLVTQGIRKVIEFGPDTKRGLAKQMKRQYATKTIEFP